MNLKRLLFGDLYRVTVRVTIGQGASLTTFLHQVYVRAKSHELAKAKALKIYTPGLAREVVSAVYVGE